MSLLSIFKKNFKLIIFFYSLVFVSSFAYFLTFEDKKVQSILYKLNYNELSKYKKEINKEILKSINAYDKYDPLILSEVSVNKLKVEYIFSSSKILFDEKKIQNIIEKSFDNAIESLNFVEWNYKDDIQKNIKNVELLEDNLRVETKIKDMIIINIMGIFVIFVFLYFRWIFA